MCPRYQLPPPRQTGDNPRRKPPGLPPFTDETFFYGSSFFFEGKGLPPSSVSASISATLPFTSVISAPNYGFPGKNHPPKNKLFLGPTTLIHSSYPCILWTRGLELR